MSLYTINDIEIFADGLDHPECVAVHPDGSIWAGGEAGQVYRIRGDGSHEVVAQTGGFVLGLAFSPEGWLAICDLKNHCIWKYEPGTKALSLLADKVEGRPMQIPNYAVFDNAGNLYVSDSGEFRKENGRIYRFDTQGNGKIWHAGPFAFANGMALSVDQQKLYVVSTWLPGVECIEIDHNGEAGKRSIVVELPKTCPDGIAIDQEGTIYISCYAPSRIYQFTAAGELMTLVDDWEAHTISNPTNLAFGGREGRDLFIANLGRWHIARLRLSVPGLPLAGQKSFFKNKPA
jgi:gluconolactonase